MRTKSSDQFRASTSLDLSRAGRGLESAHCLRTRMSARRAQMPTQEAAVKGRRKRVTSTGELWKVFFVVFLYFLPQVW